MTGAGTPRALQNVDDLYCRQLTAGDRFAIAAAELVGSWRFVLWQSVFFLIWIALNVVGWMNAWDPYPFIVMNLVLSVQAAYTAPLVLMAQNRDTARDRLMMKEDFETARRVEQEVRAIREALAQHTELLAALLEAPASRDRAGR